MLVTVTELGQTSLHPEIINKITRNTPGNAELQLTAAESLVKSYMSRYDVNAIFGTDAQSPTCINEHIKKVVKIIASYYLVRQASPNMDSKLYRADYEGAIKWLESLQAGMVNPNLPYAPETPSTETNSGVAAYSNTKRTQFF